MKRELIGSRPGQSLIGGRHVLALRWHRPAVSALRQFRTVVRHGSAPNACAPANLTAFSAVNQNQLP